MSVSSPRRRHVERAMSCHGIDLDERSLRIILAVLGWTQKDLAEAMHYDAEYVRNVVTGHVPVSRTFRDAMGKAIATKLCGNPS